MPGRQDEAVAVRPVRRFGIKAQMLFEQDRGDIGHAHRHAGMAGIRRRDGIERQGADGGGAHPMVGMCCAKGFDIH